MIAGTLLPHATLLLNTTVKMHWSEIPTDCIQMIVDQVPLINVINICLSICNKDNIRDVIKHRVSYKRLLHEIVPDADDLLESMRKHRYILIADRISRYFTPGFHNTTDGWTFVVSGNARDVRRSLGKMGIAHVSSWQSPLPSDKYSSVDTCVSTRGIMRQQHVTIRHVDHHPMTYILSLPVSPMQCFVSHIGIAHMYSHLSSIGTMLVSQSLASSWAAHQRTYTQNSCSVHARLYRISRYVSNEIHVTLDFDDAPIERLCKFIYDHREIIWESYNQHEQNIEYDDSDGEWNVTEPMDGHSSYVREEYPLSLGDDRPSRAESILLHPSRRDELCSLIDACLSECDCIGNESWKFQKSHLDAGYKHTDFAEYMNITKGWDGTNIQDCYRVRFLSDSESTVVPFIDTNTPENAILSTLR